MHTSRSVPISRDFTYIDDIVNGIILALDYTPQNCHEVYNLGTGESISVDKVLELLEKGLEKKAKIVCYMYTVFLIFSFATFFSSLFNSRFTQLKACPLLYNSKKYVFC